MTYSQKYTLVQFFSPIEQGDTFDMHEWPLHITIADTFAVDDVQSLISDIAIYINTQPVAHTAIVDESTFGETPVWILENTKDLYDFHNSIIAIFNSHHVTFNHPEFTGLGFVPHISKNLSTDMHIGDRILINIVSLVDMFPERDWKKRRVVQHIKPSQIQPGAPNSGQ